MNGNNIDADCELSPPNRFASKIGFQDRTILITGGSGFLGKVFIEKLLRTCPKVKKVYVLMRQKNGQHPAERLDKIFSGPLYDLLRKTHGKDIFAKVVIVQGDCRLPDLGLSHEDRKTLIEETEFVLHMAATIRLEERLKETILLNTRGTKLMLELAKQMKKLQLFIHVSTAFCHPEEKVLREKIYPPPADPNRVINLVEILEDSALNAITKKVIGASPNTYIFSKALAESLVAGEMDKIPIIIIRPSLVISIWKDPLPGWCDSLNGPPGIYVAIGKGIWRTNYCVSGGYIDFMPVDTVANSIFAISFDYLLHRERNVYNVTSTNYVKVLWEEIFEIGLKAMRGEMPLNWALWYPGGSIETNKFVHKVYIVLFHYIPAILVDALLILTLNKPVLWKIQRRVSKGMEVFNYFVSRHWEFDNEGSTTAKLRMNETEKRIYSLGHEDFDSHKYIISSMHGYRLYLLNETDESIPTARRHLKIMWAIDRVTKIVFALGFLYLLLKYILQPFCGVTLFK